MSDGALISLLLPTRGRPEGVRRLLESIARTASRPRSIEVVIRADADDAASHAFEQAPLAVRVLVGRPDKMGRMVRQCYQASAGRIIGQFNDDLLCRTAGWDEAIARALAAYRDGVALAWCDDGFRGGRICNFPFLTRQCCEMLGGPCPPEYNRDYIDTHLFDIFGKLSELGHRRLAYLPNVLIEHLHVEAGKAEADATALKPRPQADELTYLAWEDQRAAMARRLARRICAAAREGSCAC